jgi:NADH dehydrogenase
MIGEAIDKPRPIIGLPVWMAFVAARTLGYLMNDVMLTRDEVEGLMSGLLQVEAPPAGDTKLTEWAQANGKTLGLRYASELARRR